LETIRDTIVRSLPVARVPAFLAEHCLNIGAVTPRYVRLIGRGSVESGFSAELINPFAVKYTGPYRLQAVGRDGVGFLANGARVCLLRAKWESEKLASTLKFSVDQWT
jgi:hypothetical protein